MAVLQRHLISPLLQERLEYLQHCANQDYGLKTSEALVRKQGTVTLLRGLCLATRH